MRTAFITKPVIEVKLQNIAIWNVSNLGLCRNLVTLIINFKSE